jgi:hypothetical protein
MAKHGKGKTHTVSIIIQWREEDAEVMDNAPSNSKFEAASLSQRLDDETAHYKGQHSTQDVGGQSSSNRLLPSDRVVLDALRARIPRGGQVTTLVRIRDLEVDCGISRRQVQICLKRLSEKGFIKRLLEDASPGSIDGYQYQLLNDVLRG